MDSDKKKTKIIIVIVAAAVLALIISVCAVPVSSYISGLNAPLEEIAPTEEISDSVVAEVITDEEVEKLLNGETTLEDLENSLAEQVIEDENEEPAPSEADSSAAEAEEQPEAESTASSAESEKAASSKASSKAVSSSASGASSKAASGSEAAASSAASASHTASSAASKEPAYETEVKALIQELYVLRAQALADLNACVESARTEYHSLPKSQQTQAKKIAIAFSRAGQLTKLQSYYDKEVDRIVGEMRRVLEENGQSTALADEALASYKSQKSDMYSTLMKKLYD